jgi:hypothetical protein
MKITLTEDNGLELNSSSYDLGKSLKKLREMEEKIAQLRPQICSLNKIFGNLAL